MKLAKIKSKKVAELIGMHVGDGTLYKTNWSLVWELRGGLNEKNYYNDYVKELLFDITREKFYPKYRSGGKNGCYGIQTSKKVVTNIIENYGFKPGKKTLTVRIPSYIKQSSKSIKYAFIRGLFDTDGCLRFKRINNRPKHTYPQIEFCFASKNLRDDLFELLKELEYRIFKWGTNNSYKVALSGTTNLEKFMKEISSKNAKHINKYLLWKRNGYV